MSKVFKKVWVISCNEDDYEEKFKDELLKWKPGERKLMGRNAAALFLGQCRGGSIKKKFKSEPYFEPDEPKEAQKFVCQVDGKEFASQAELDKHIEGLRRKLQLTK